MINRIIKACVLVLGVVWLAGCASKKPQMSTLEVRTMQTKDYENADQLLVYKALVNALLDREFVIKASDSEAGVLIATHTTTSLNTGEAISKAVGTYMLLGLNWVFGDNNLDDTLTIDVSSNVTRLGKITKVRINAVAKRMNSDGEVVESQMIVDPAYYDNIFQQIEKSVFLEENLDV